MVQLQAKIHTQPRYKAASKSSTALLAPQFINTKPDLFPRRSQQSSGNFSSPYSLNTSDPFLLHLLRHKQIVQYALLAKSALYPTPLVARNQFFAMRFSPIPKPHGMCIT